MTPYELVKQACANFDVPTGECICRPGKSCLVKDGDRCRYFERAVLPVADEAPPADAPKLQASRLKARDAYLAAFGQTEPAKPCPDCGQPKPRNHSRCPECAAKRRRANHRQQVRAKRSRSCAHSVEK